MQERLPCGVVSLLEMMEYYAHIYLEWTNKLAAWEKVSGESQPRVAVRPDYAAVLYAEIAVFAGMCRAHSFASTARQCERMVEMFQRSRQNNDSLTCGPLREELSALRKRLEDELENHKFFHLSVDETELYNFPIRHWEKVIARFHRTQIDIEESSKCFAFARYAASLFHILLVAELGVIELASLLDVQGDKPGWGSLGRVEKIAAKPYKERSDLEQKHSKLLEEIIPFAHSMKNQWRHKIHHVDNKLVFVDSDFSPQMAKDIISGVRGFMDKLATDMPK